MNDHELDLALADFGATRVQPTAPPLLRQRIGTMPLPSQPRRAWLPPPSTRRFQTMFSATKFVVAGAIVALFGGFLLAGVLTQPSEDVAPAAVSPSPSTGPDLLPGVDLVTEEVEPGVFRVLSDGTDRDMSHVAIAPHGSTQVVAGQDGSVWVRLRQPPDEDRLFRVGLAGSIDATGLLEWRPDISVDPDGVVWALARPGTQLWSLADGEWTRHAAPSGTMLTDIETPADGNIWTSWAEGSPISRGCTATVARLVDGEWQEEDIEQDMLVGHAGSLAIGPDGTTLLGSMDMGPCVGDAWAGVLERVEDGWVPSIEPDESQHRLGVGPIAIGKDGTAWAWTPGDGHFDPWGPRLYRRTDGEWELLGDDGSVPMLISPQVWDGPSMTVSADGRLWIAFEGPGVANDHRDFGDKSYAATLDGECAGVLSFDGATWRQHLAGACATHVSAAPNGNVWVIVPGLDPVGDMFPAGARRAAHADLPQGPAGLYVITPEAVVATDLVATESAPSEEPTANDTSTSTPDLVPGVDLITEEVEPGVERIVSDGIRDLSRVGPGRKLGPAPPDGLAVAPNGAVWLDAGSTLIKLGDPDSFPMPSSHWPDLKVSPDGTLWARTGSATSIGRLEGDGWSEMAGLDTGMEGAPRWDFAPDGTVWTGRSQARVARLDASGWQDYPIDLDSFDLDLQQLREAYGDDTAGQRPYFEDLRVGANGDVWAALSVNDGAFASMILLRYDGEAWSVEDPLGLGGYYTVDLLDVGPDGTMWVYLEAGRDARNEPEGHYLARLADDRWTVFSEEDGVEQLVWRAENYGLLRVDHDGAVWVRPQDGGSQGQGVRVFDGKTWRQYLDGHDVIDMEVAPDGRVWVLTSDHLYRITPEAVAATE